MFSASKTYSRPSINSDASSAVAAALQARGFLTEPQSPGRTRHNQSVARPTNPHARPKNLFYRDHETRVH